MLPLSRLIVGSLLMGPAIAGMHYTGMAAMRMTPAIEYDPACLRIRRDRDRRVGRGAVDRVPPARAFVRRVPVP